MYPPHPKKCIYFWRPQDARGEFGQWYDSKFNAMHNGTPVTFLCAEQYMMWRKALLFNDDEIAAQTLKTKDPKTVKALGRKVRNFQQDLWNKEKLNIVIEGNYLKFTQNEDLKKLLLQTGDRYLVEASPMDKIWGIGLTEEKARAGEKWRGENLLGIALMKARERIVEEEQQKEKQANSEDAIWQF